MVGRRDIAAILVGLVAGGIAAASASPDQKPDPNAFSIVGGTVFRDNGLSLPGAEVTLEPVAADPAQPAATAVATKAKSKSKLKPLQAISSPRGEFTFRVPPVAAKYRVSAKARGFRGDSKVVEISGGGERVEATFSLSPESK